eukprot:jgi/Mesvir1/19935/Mv13201-RA.4
MSPAVGPPADGDEWNPAEKPPVELTWTRYVQGEGINSPTARLPSDVAIKARCKQLGINYSPQGAHLWIAEELSRAPLPDSWSEYFDDAGSGRVFYYDHERGESQWAHPLFGMFKAMYQRILDAPHLHAYFRRLYTRIRELCVKDRRQWETLQILVTGSGQDATPAEVEDMCSWLGIDFEAEPQLVWIAKHAAEIALPPGWEEDRDENGEPLFHNLRDGSTSVKHPMDDYFLALIEEERELLASEQPSTDKKVLALRQQREYVPFRDTAGQTYYVHFGQGVQTYFPPWEIRYQWAARRIQREWRAWVEWARKVVAATVTIQRYYRGHLVRTAVGMWREQRELRRQLAREERAAITIQRAFRRHLTRLDIRLVALEDASATIIQSYWRGYLARQMYKRHLAARTIQTAWRRHMAQAEADARAQAYMNTCGLFGLPPIRVPHELRWIMKEFQAAPLPAGWSERPNPAFDPVTGGRRSKSSGPLEDLDDETLAADAALRAARGEADGADLTPRPTLYFHDQDRVASDIHPLLGAFSGLYHKLAVDEPHPVMWAWYKCVYFRLKPYFGDDQLKWYSINYLPRPMTRSFPEPQEVRDMADYLGIDPVTEGPLLWVARQSVQLALPLGFEERVDENHNTYYFNITTEEVVAKHPVDAVIRHILTQQRAQARVRQNAVAAGLLVEADPGVGEDRQGGGGGGEAGVGGKRRKKRVGPGRYEINPNMNHWMPFLDKGGTLFYVHFGLREQTRFPPWDLTFQGAARRIQRAWRRMKLRRARKAAAILTIQGAYRLHRIRKKLRARQAERAAIRIQSAYRRHLARKLLRLKKWQHKAATAIQRSYRRHLARRRAREQQFRALGTAAVTIQRWWRATCQKLAQRKEATQKRRRAGLARVIQRHWRRYTARKRAARMRAERSRHHAAATTIQRHWRGHAARKLAEKLRNGRDKSLCATRIQTCWRGYRARKYRKQLKVLAPLRAAQFVPLRPLYRELFMLPQPFVDPKVDQVIIKRALAGMDALSEAAIEHLKQHAKELVLERKAKAEEHVAMRRECGLLSRLLNLPPKHWHQPLEEGVCGWLSEPEMKKANTELKRLRAVKKLNSSVLILEAKAMLEHLWTTLGVKKSYREAFQGREPIHVAN